MKLPEHQYAATLAFYRDVLGLEIEREQDSGAVVVFGAVKLHLDRVAHQSQADLWLELYTEDSAAAAAYLSERGVARCDSVEPLPDTFDGFWIAAPAGTIHLVSAPKGG